MGFEVSGCFALESNGREAPRLCLRDISSSMPLLLAHPSLLGIRESCFGLLSIYKTSLLTPTTLALLMEIRPPLRRDRCRHDLLLPIRKGAHGKTPHRGALEGRWEAQSRWRV